MTQRIWLYCQGAFDEQAWLLIAILKPEPHKLARDNNQMHKIGKMAEAFSHAFLNLYYE